MVAHSLLSGWKCLIASLWLYDCMYTVLEFPSNDEEVIIGYVC
jgi:hypothetical protein